MLKFEVTGRFSQDIPILCIVLANLVQHVKIDYESGIWNRKLLSYTKAFTKEFLPSVQSLFWFKFGNPESRGGIF